MSPINEDKTVGHMEDTKEKMASKFEHIIVYTLGRLQTTGWIRMCALV